jgi:hypothetical protein
VFCKNAAPGEEAWFLEMPADDQAPGQFVVGLENVKIRNDSFRSGPFRLGRCRLRVAGEVWETLGATRVTERTIKQPRRQKPAKQPKPRKERSAASIEPLRLRHPYKERCKGDTLAK